MSKKTLIRLVSIAVLMAMCAVSFVVVSVPASAETEYITYRTGGNSVSSYYKNSKFYKQLTSVPYTGDNATDVVAVALSQLGYIEGSSQSAFDGVSGGGSGNFCEMNWNIGGGIGYGYYWCASFVSFCLFQGRATDHGTFNDMCRNHYDDVNYIWKEISCTAWIRNLKVAKAFQWSKYFGGSYTPKTGDIIFYTWSANTSSGADHTGVVVYSDGTYVYTMEGNTSSGSGLEDNGDGAYFKKYELTSPYIYGYGVPPYKNVNEKVKIDFSGRNPTPGLYVNAHYNAKYLYSDEACTTTLTTVPKYTQVEVTQVVKKINSGNDLSILKVNYTDSSGKTHTGYMKDTKDVRLIQIAASNNFIPEKPEVKTFSSNSVTLESGGAGYEYKVDSGSWQKSNFFKGLSDSKSYKFYQRYNGGEASPALSVNLGTLLKSKELKSITVDGYDLLPEFSADTKAYNVKVPNTLTTVPDVKATAAVSSTKVSIDVGNIINKTAVVYVNLTPAVGPKATYTVSFLYLPENELNTPEETDPIETIPSETAPGETDDLGTAIPPVETDEFGNEIPPVETDEFGNIIPPAETNDTLEGETGSETDAKADAGSIISKLGCKASSATLAVSGVVGLISLFTIVGVKKKKED